MKNYHHDQERYLSLSPEDLVEEILARIAETNERGEDLHRYQSQSRSNTYLPLTDELFKMISDQELFDELIEEGMLDDDCTVVDFEYTTLELTDKDRCGLMWCDEKTVEKFNEFRSQFREWPSSISPVIVLVDYDNGVVYTVRFSEQ